MPTLNDAPIAVIGLGYVGLPLAVEFGKKRKVVGFDINAARIAELRAGKDNTLEVDAAEMAAAAHLSFTDQLDVPPSSSPSLPQLMSTSVPISPPYSKHPRRSEKF